MYWFTHQSYSHNNQSRLTDGWIFIDWTNTTGQIFSNFFGHVQYNSKNLPQLPNFDNNFIHV